MAFIDNKYGSGLPSLFLSAVVRINILLPAMPSTVLTELFRWIVVMSKLVTRELLCTVT